jgi:hypothetical protein
MSHYETLGVTSAATTKELKQAYRLRAMELHPDRNLERDTTSEFQQLQAAFAVLGDSQKRAEHNMRGGMHSGVKVRSPRSENERLKRPSGRSLGVVLRYARKAFGAMDYFAHMQDLRSPANRKRGAVEMMEDINWCAEVAARHSSPELYVEAASALSLYSVWYCHTSLGEDKAAPLAQAVKMLEAAVQVATDKAEFQLRLATLLWGKPQVRDLKRARDIVNGVTNQKFKKYAGELLIVIDRFEGTPTFNLKFSYATMAYIPIGSFYEERKNCRAVIRAFKEGDDIETLRPVLEHLYRIAILGEAAGAIMTRTSGKDHSKHIKHLKKSISVVKQMTYGANGVLKMGWQYKPVLSAGDYKVFELLYGKADKEFNPHSLLDFDMDESIKLANERIAGHRLAKASELHGRTKAVGG